MNEKTEQLIYRLLLTAEIEADILFILLGYFVYGKNVSMTLAVAVFVLVGELSLYATFIPFAGVFVQGFILYEAFIRLSALSGLSWSALILAMIIYFLVFGAIITLLVSFKILAKSKLGFSG